MRTRYFLGIGSLLAALLSGCGGGGGGSGGGESSTPEPSGGGWITITYPESSSGSTSTNSSSVFLSGDAFISARHWRCCTGHASDTGVTVTWSNATTGASGTAHQTPKYVCLFSTCVLIGHSWYASIPLAVGGNITTVTAIDPSGYFGRATIAVTRTPDITPPTVSATSPASGATGVGTNSAFLITFSEAMDPASISTFTIGLKDNLKNPVSGSVTYANRVATFTPATNLQGLTTFTATVTTGAKDIAGNALATDYVSTFTTHISSDFAPPTVSSTSPTNGATTCVSTETDVIATFSEPVSGASVNADSFVLRDGSNNLVSGSVGLGFDERARFFPNSPLANSSTYTGTITTGLTDLSGNHLAADYIWTFTTEAVGTGTWNSTSAIGSPSPREGHTVVWTGTEMIVWGGSGRTTGVIGDGARYHPASDTWLPVSTVGAPEARSGHVAIWTGSKMIIWGGVRPGAFLSSGAIYDPATDSWTSMSSSGAPSARQFPTAVWTGTEIIVCGGSTRQSGTDRRCSSGEVRARLRCSTMEESIRHQQTLGQLSRSRVHPPPGNSIQQSGPARR